MTRLRQLWAGLPVFGQLAVLGGAVLVLIWSILLVDVKLRMDHERASADEQLHTVSRVSAQALGGAVRLFDLMLLDFREHLVREHGNFSELAQRTRASAVIGFPFEVNVVDAAGRLALSTMPNAPLGMDLSERGNVPLLRAQSNDPMLVSAPYPVLGDPQQRTMIHFSRRVPDAAGGHAGVVTISVAPQYLARLYETLDLGDGGTLSVVRDDGAVLVRSFGRAGLVAPAGSGGGAAALTFIAERARTGPAEQAILPLRSPVDGVERMYTWNRLSDYPLVLVLGRPEASLYRAAMAARDQALVGGLITSVLVLLALYALLSHNRNRAESAQRLHEQLAQLTRSETELAASRQALRDASAHYVAAAEKERQLMAREVHDEIGQRLSALRMALSRLPREVQASPEPGLAVRLEPLKANVDDMLYLVRQLAHRLRPSALEFGLTPAVQTLLGELSGGSGIQYELDNRLPEDLSLDENRSVAIFRILEEALRNAARHSGATLVRVRLEVMDEHFALRVHDNGRGIGRAGREPLSGWGFGLTAMRERALALGGQVRISGNATDGTTVKAFIPLTETVAPPNEITAK